MFGIEIDNALLMEIGLNALGYFAAGGLSVMLYSAITKRRWRIMFAEIIEQSAEIVARSNMAAKNAATQAIGESGFREPVDGGAELWRVAADSKFTGGFVSFESPDRFPSESYGSNVTGSDKLKVDSAVSHHRHAHSVAHSVNNSVTSSVINGVTSASGAVGDYTRNRSNVIRLAKEMLESGRTSESVRNELPISDSEMRLVEIGSRR
jgi:hypothetical protein